MMEMRLIMELEVMEFSHLSFWQRWSLRRAPGQDLGRIYVTPLAAARLTRVDFLLALTQHKRGPWDGVGERWHNCMRRLPENCFLESFPPGFGWNEFPGRAIYSVHYTPEGETILVRSAADRSSTLILLGEEEGCGDGPGEHCELCEFYYNRLHFSRVNRLHDSHIQSLTPSCE